MSVLAGSKLLLIKNSLEVDTSLAEPQLPDSL